ncbi:hypothetical protein KFK09_012816 [Dendrobium nobile]|uniref:Uncharacterized protein n=1 Tax=Dendrobium nobile TaxID=94219 RepID=A0A8T3BLW4_DENNO|nr:hypothetical protein KFK09_012816 [Dendrobium nobile]
MPIMCGSNLDPFTVNLGPFKGLQCGSNLSFPRFGLSAGSPFSGAKMPLIPQLHVLPHNKLMFTKLSDMNCMVPNLELANEGVRGESGPLVGADSEERATGIGDFAHLEARSDGGGRFRRLASANQRGRGWGSGLWCRANHKETRDGEGDPVGRVQLPGFMRIKERRGEKGRSGARRTERRREREGENLELCEWRAPERANYWVR